MELVERSRRRCPVAQRAIITASTCMNLQNDQRRGSHLVLDYKDKRISHSFSVLASDGVRPSADKAIAQAFERSTLSSPESRRRPNRALTPRRQKWQKRYCSQTEFRRCNA